MRRDCLGRAMVSADIWDGPTAHMQTTLCSVLCRNKQLWLPTATTQAAQCWFGDPEAQLWVQLSDPCRAAFSCGLRGYDFMQL